MQNEWLLLSSSADALLQMAARAQEGASDAARIPLLPVSGPQFSGLILNADLPRAYESLVKAVAVYDLANYTQDDSRRAPGRRLMDGVMTWLDAVRPFGRLSVEARAEGEEIEALIRLGDAGESAGARGRERR
jgi:hypothetical protein